MKDAIITVDRDLTITALNEAGHGICVFNRDAVGKPLRQAAEGCDMGCLRTVEETLRTKQPINRYKFECSRQETGLVLTMNVSPLLDHQGESTGAVIVIRDETRLNSLERDLKKRRHFHNRLIGKSESMQEIYSLIEDLAGVRTTVLIRGESGTGKELVADALHYAGSRKDRPLVKVNCSALSESLLESELFGHVKGAFTGAMNDKTGRFEKASGGTIFLDEIGDLSPKIQQKLLRVLQEKEFERVGDSTPVKVDVRIVAATNRDLRAMAARGEFREDLLYRLRVVEIKLPPLRERSEDIPLLVEFFLSEFNREFSKKIEGVSSDVMKLFMDYRWPGNVRELRHALEHVCVLCKKPTITTEDLPSEFRELSGIKSELPADLTTDEASVFLQALKDAKWNKTEVARLLGMSRQTLYRKLKALGIED